MSLRTQALSVAAEQTTRAQAAQAERQRQEQNRLRTEIAAFFALPATLTEARTLITWDFPLKSYGGDSPRIREQAHYVLQVDDLEVVSEQLLNRYGRGDQGVYPVLACIGCSRAYAGLPIDPPRGDYIVNHQRVSIDTDRNGYRVLSAAERQTVLLANIAKVLTGSPKLCPACILAQEGQTCSTCRRDW